MDDIKTYSRLRIPKDSAWERNTFWRKLPSWLKEFLTGCNNLIKWAPTIWKQRDWDDAFIFDVLQKKIEFQRKELVSANRHTRIDADNRDMTIVLNLLERVRNEYYGMEYLDYRETKLRFEDIKDNPKRKRVEIDIIWEEDDKFLSKYPSTVRKVIKDKPDINKSDLCHLVSQYNEEKANDLLFRILRERMRWWWD
jgi:hypothetical protein